MRARTRNLLLVTAAAATILLAFLLLREEGRPGPGEPAPVRGRRESTAGESPVATPLRTPAESPPAEAPVPEGPRLDLRAVVGEWGLPGVQVLAAERFRDGTLVASIADDAPEGGETDAEGRITLRYTSEPAERLFGVLADGQPFDGAENAEDVGAIGSFRVFRAPSPGPVTLRYRDAAGAILLRPVDADTGEALGAWEGIGFRGITPDSDEEWTVPARTDPAGWIQRPPEMAQGLRLCIPGYLPAPEPAGGWKGRTVVRMDADPTAVRGRVFAGSGSVVTARLVSTVDGREAPPVSCEGLPDRAQGAGPRSFALAGLPAGSWELVVRFQQPMFGRTPTQWARVRFVYQGNGLDIGEIRPAPGAILRARLLGLDGAPEDAASLRLARSVPGSLPLLQYGSSRIRTGVSIEWPREVEPFETVQGEPEEDGWLRFEDLLPGGEYVLATGKVPGLVRTVTMPVGDSPDPLSVVLDARGPSTHCVLRFTVEGEEPRFWQGFSGPAFTEAFSTGKGTLEADIPPGRYRFAASAGIPFPAGGELEDVEGATLQCLVEGEVEIPDAVRFEAAVDLKRRAR